MSSEADLEQWLVVALEHLGFEYQLPGCPPGFSRETYPNSSTVVIPCPAQQVPIEYASEDGERWAPVDLVLALEAQNEHDTSILDVCLLELKNGRVGPNAVGQIARYLGAADRMAAAGELEPWLEKIGCCGPYHEIRFFGYLVGLQFADPALEAVYQMPRVRALRIGFDLTEFSLCEELPRRERSAALELRD